MLNPNSEYTAIICQNPLPAIPKAQRRFPGPLFLVSFLSLLSTFSASLGWAQALLENPQPGSFQSGVGVISGWVCEAGRIDIVFNPGTENEMTLQAGYGTNREDTEGICNDINNGFGLLFNWNRLGDGQHTVQAQADREVFGSATITVTTLGQDFLTGASGEFVVEDFPTDGNILTLGWQQTTQNFVIQGGMRSSGGTSGAPPHVLENPPPGSFQSGVGVISGWVCEAERVDIVFNPGTAKEQTIRATYGTNREDTQGACNDIDNGFGLLFNWNRLDDGVHTVQAQTDGEVFGSATVTVTTFGKEFLRGASGEFTLSNFPEIGADVVVRWQEAQQNFVITDVSPSQTYVPPVYIHALFVDGAVPASGDGTRARPFKTINAAVKAARPSTAIHIVAGRYDEYVVIYEKNDIGLLGATRDAVTISNPDGFGVLCNKTNELVIHSVTITGKNGIGLLACDATFADIVVARNASRGIIVANLEPTDPTTASSLTLYNAQVRDNEVGVAVDHTSSLSAYETAFNQNTADGVRVTSSGTVTLDDCDLSANGRDGFNWKNASPDPGMLTMSQSTISDNSRAGIILLNAVNGTINGSRVIGNGYGVRWVNGLEFYFSWQGTFTISNSTFMNNASFGIFIASGTVTLENNVIDGNGQNGLGVYHGCDGDCSSLPIEIVLRDNIIRNHQGTNQNDGIGLTLAQYIDPPINVILAGGNEFYNNRNHHVGCASSTNWLNLTCEEPAFSSNDVKLISTCSEYRVCSATACPEFCG